MAVDTQAEEPKQIDSAAFIQQRNTIQQAKIEGKEAPLVEKPADTEKPKIETKPENDSAIPIPRRARRELNRLRDEAAELRGRLAAYQELGVKPEVPRGTETKSDDPEPKR